MSDARHPELADAPYLRLVPRAVPRPWGGQRVARRFGWPDPGPCGEWWLASSFAGTETELADADLDLAAWLDGPGRERGLPGAADFPLLVKFLDCEQVLSVQVHPDDALAARVGQARGKSEAWHVLEAAPGALVWLGLADGVTPDDLLDAVGGGVADTMVRGLLREVPVHAGQTIAVPAGTVHAIGPGLVLYEVQQNSDATYRIHDWGRGRELHLDLARQALATPPLPAPAAPATLDRGVTDLLTWDAFSLRNAHVSGELDLALGARFALLTVLAGTGRLLAADDEARLSAGDTLLVMDPVRLIGHGLQVLVAAPS